MKSLNKVFYLSRVNEKLNFYMPVWFFDVHFRLTFIGKYFNTCKLSEKHKTAFLLKTTVYENVILIWL